MDSLKDNYISLCMFWDNSLYDPAECVKKITDISSEVEPPFQRKKNLITFNKKTLFDKSKF